ncbi:hypothetical protein FRB97_001273 [Tulasnella sp. 331]|nr:hypothetical protein FRB97_001273 [Tulasnella sp. 331]
MSAPSHPDIPTGNDPNYQTSNQAYGTPTANQLDKALVDMLAGAKKAPSRGDASSPDEASLAYALALLSAASDHTLPESLFEPAITGAVSVRVNATQVLAARPSGNVSGSSNESGNSAPPAPPMPEKEVDGSERMER